MSKEKLFRPLAQNDKPVYREGNLSLSEFIVNSKKYNWGYEKHGRGFVIKRGKRELIVSWPAFVERILPNIVSMRQYTDFDTLVELAFGEK